MNPNPPMFIDDVRAARLYLTQHDLKHRQATVEVGTRAWERLRSAFEVLRLSLPVEFRPRSIESEGYFWHFAEMAGLESKASLSDLQGPDDLIFCFEDLPDVAFLVQAHQILGKELSKADVYVLADDWIFCLSHEQANGPYLVPLD